MKSVFRVGTGVASGCLCVLSLATVSAGWAVAFVALAVLVGIIGGWI